MKNNKTLFFGPYPAPFTGQSISFKQAYDNFSGTKILFNSAKFKSNKILNSIYCLIFLPIVFVTSRFNKVYFTCSRSKLGFIKDLQLIILSSFFKKKIINHLHGADLKLFYENSGFLKRIVKWSYDKIDTNIVLLPEMKNQFSEFSNAKIEVVENCYSNELKSVNIDLESKKPQVLYLSNLIFSKGIFVFLEAAEQMLELRKDIIIKIAGAPMGDSYMTSQEANLSFNEKSNYLKELYPDRYFYLGVVKGKSKENLLKESSIFVLPTFYITEAFPLTIIESMCFGNAIVTTKHNYLPYILNSKNGFLIDIKSSKQIIESIMSLFEDKNKLRLIQEHNITEANQKYNPENFNKKIEEIIKNI